MGCNATIRDVKAFRTQLTVGPNDVTVPLALSDGRVIVRAKFPAAVTGVLNASSVVRHFLRVAHA